MWHFDQLDCFSGFEVLKPFKQKKNKFEWAITFKSKLIISMVLKLSKKEIKKEK